MVARRRYPFTMAALPFIYAADDSSGAFVVDEHAVSILAEQCGDLPVCVIAVVGLFRTGKSFLLNALLRGGDGDGDGDDGEGAAASNAVAAGDGDAPDGFRGFEVGPTIEACTKGILVWSVPLRRTLPGSGDPCAVLLLDTEGVGGTEATAQYDARIFSLATLLRR